MCNNGQVLRASARRWRWGKLVRESDRGVLRMAGGTAENAKRRERESGVEKNRMGEPLQEAVPNARRTCRERNVNEFAP